ncbi:MAG: cytochrome c biogenesis protein DipZ [bacterium]|nr:cytochrome c biogenesis protein DipZ [bacterium]
MILLLPFAFLAGIVTILSPCILPILPIVLSGSVTGGKRRPWGVVVGFIASFTFFTLLLTAIVRLTGISADAIRLLSVVVVFGFGLSLLLPQLERLTERLFSSFVRFSPRIDSNGGFWSGILLGLSLGLVWTPCVGPILASVISLALQGSVSGEATLITLAYATGTAIPLLGITYGGRQLLTRIPWLLQNTLTIRRIFGILMITTALMLFFQLDRKFQTFILERFPQYGVGLTRFEDNAVVKQELKTLKQPTDKQNRGKPMFDVINDNLTRAPEFIPGGEWINSDPLTMQELRGKVVLIDFWTYSCINCIRTLPYLKAWDKKYREKGLVIVGVHTPEFEFEKKSENVRKAVADFDIKYAVMQDNNYATWRAYDNHYWPAKYFIDRRGIIRSSHFGEGEYNESERLIQELLAETGAAVSDMPIENPSYTIQSKTPELYLGYGRMSAFAQPEQISRDREAEYSVPTLIPPNRFAFHGRWTISEEYAEAGKDASLSLNFESKDVFLVMRPSDVGGRVRVLLDGKAVDATSAGDDVKDGIVIVDEDRLYRLIRLSSPGRHVLTLEFLDNGLELYAFTFG